MKFYCLIFLLFLPSLSFANLIDEFFSKFNLNSNYYIYQDKKLRWQYDCVVYINMLKGGLNINTVSFDKINKKVKFTFDSSDHPFYKLTKVIKVNSHEYILYFHDKEDGSNFSYDVRIGKYGISFWDYHDSTENSENFNDRSFILLSFDGKPKINILNSCKLD